MKAGGLMEFDEVKDSGERQEFDTGSVRDTRTGKGRFDLLPSYAITRLARHFENGAVKYGDRNWEKGQPLTRYLDSALRHVFGLLEGKTDEDHAAAAAWNVLAFIETQERVRVGALPEELDDLPRGPEPPVDRGTFNGLVCECGCYVAGVGGTPITDEEYAAAGSRPALAPGHTV